MTSTSKTCTKCSKSKNRRENFYKGAGYADGYQSICKTCRVKFPSQTPRSTLDRVYRTRSRNRQYVFSFLLEHPCVDCDEGDPIVLEFDHVRGEKTANVSILIHNTSSLKRIQAEIDKCDVVCANCHRRRTAITQDWDKAVLA